jgi:hypothetical protein
MKKDQFNIPLPCTPRKIPQPNDDYTDCNIEEYNFYCNINDLPEDIPYDANARVPNINRAKYKTVIDTLCNNPGMFRIKNKGIVILTTDTVWKNNKFQLTIPPGYGLADGGHTNAIIQKYKDMAADNQSVSVKVLSNVPEELVSEIAEGYNTSMQVTEESLLNQRNHFDKFKESLEGKIGYDKISYKQNEKGPVDVSQLVRVMYAVNTKHFPITKTSIHSYNSTAKCIKHFSENLS